MAICRMSEVGGFGVRVISMYYITLYYRLIIFIVIIYIYNYI